MHALPSPVFCLLNALNGLAALVLLCGFTLFYAERYITIACPALPYSTLMDSTLSCEESYHRQRHAQVAPAGLAAYYAALGLVFTSALGLVAGARRKLPAEITTNIFTLLIAVNAVVWFLEFKI